jgi:integrase
MPSFFEKLRAYDTTAARALEFTILTATRTSEVVNAQWSEFDLMNRIWTVPADRMKSRREHRVPLTAVAIAILKRQRLDAFEGPVYVFPGRDPEHPLSNMAMLSLLQKQMGYDHITVHGFRSTFKDWAGECTNTPNEVSEHALAHVISNKAEAAYRRGDLFEKRRKLMDEWATHCLTRPVAERRIA